LAYAAWERRQIPSKNDEDEIPNVAHQLNHAVQKNYLGNWQSKKKE
jgi:hypothetical protein